MESAHASSWVKWPRKGSSKASASTNKAPGTPSKSNSLKPHTRVAQEHEPSVIAQATKMSASTKAEQAEAKRMLKSLLAAACRSSREISASAPLGYFRAAQVLAQKLGRRHEKRVERELKKMIGHNVRKAKAAIWWRRKRFKDAYAALLVATRLAQEGQPPTAMVEKLRRTIEKTWRKRQKTPPKTNDLREAEKALLDEWASIGGGV